MIRPSSLIFRRCIHNTCKANQAQKLPFEKPIYQSEILIKAKEEKQSLNRLAFYGNLVVIAVGISAAARISYYCLYGKNNGAKALPRRKEQ